MTVVDNARPSHLAARTHRRYEIVVSGGLSGALTAAEALRGLPVRDFSVDVREGIMCSALICTISMTADEAARFAARLAELPAVVSVDPS